MKTFQQHCAVWGWRMCCFVLWIGAVNSSPAQVLVVQNCTGAFWPVAASSFAFPPGQSQWVLNSAFVAVWNADAAVSGSAINDTQDNVLLVPGQDGAVVLTQFPQGTVRQADMKNETPNMWIGFGLALGWFGVGWAYRMVRRIGLTN